MDASLLKTYARLILTFIEVAWPIRVYFYTHEISITDPILYLNIFVEVLIMVLILPMGRLAKYWREALIIYFTINLSRFAVAVSFSNGLISISHSLLLITFNLILLYLSRRSAVQPKT